jgi:hypothetical protein
VGELLHLHNDHEQAQALLPWYVNDTLDPEESAFFEAHPADCDECRTELAAERAFRQAYAGAPVGAPTGRRSAPSFDKVGARPFIHRLQSGWGKATQIAFAAAAAATLIVAIAPRESEGEFRLLGADGEAAVGNAIVLFAPDTPERELRAALDQAGARLVDGPTASGAYVVQVPGQRREAALAGLRALPQVVLAEPVDAPSGP